MLFSLFSHNLYVLPQKEQYSLFLVADRLRQGIGEKLQLVSCQKLCSSVHLLCFYINSQTFKKAKYQIELLPKGKNLPKSFDCRKLARAIMERCFLVGHRSSACQALDGSSRVPRATRALDRGSLSL